MHYDLPRIRRLATEAIGAMTDDELAERAGVPIRLAPALRGARDLNEARDSATAILEPEPAPLAEDAALTLVRFRELLARANGSADPARSFASSRRSGATSARSASRSPAANAGPSSGP